jgi:HK97 family phage major capsid protein
MAALQEILDEMARIRQELQRMEDSDETTEENDGDFRDTLVARWEELDKASKPIIERMERVKAITRATEDESNLERPDGAAGGIVTSGNGRRAGPDLVTSRYHNPYDCQDLIRNERQILMRRSELRGRGLDAIELEAKRGNLPHDRAEEATRKAQDNAGIARHMLLYGSQEYQDAFRAYTEDPEHLDEASRAVLTLTGGSVMLPFVLDPTIVLTNGASANPWRRISNVKQTTSNTWNGVASAGINAAWITETTAATDVTPTVSAITVTPVKAAAWVTGTYELLEDSNFGEQLPALLADAKDRLEEAAFATGTGAGVPPGFIPAATTVVTTATTTVIALGDVYAVQAALPARFRNAPGAAWVANVAIINKIRQLDTAGGSSFWTNLGKGQPETLLGAPIYESTTMTASVATTSLMAIFGDFGQALIVDRVGVSIIYDPLVQASGGIVPAGEAGWYCFWRTGSALTSVNAFRVMKGL